MKIKMLQLVEDAHSWAVENEETGKIDQGHNVVKFQEGMEYDHSEDYPDWDRRAKKLIAMGYAEEVKE